MNLSPVKTYRSIEKRDMVETTKKISFSFKDTIAMSLSIAAFTLSLVNFYFSNFRINNNLTARSVRIDKTWNNNIESIIIKVVINNSGNRQGILLAPHFQIADTVAPKKGTWKDIFSVKNENSFPVILSPHEMKIIDLEMPIEQILARPGKISTDLASVQKLGIIFFSLDSKSKQHIVWTDFNIELSSEAGKLNSIALNDYLDKSNSTNLFDN